MVQAPQERQERAVHSGLGIFLSVPQIPGGSVETKYFKAQGASSILSFDALPVSMSKDAIEARFVTL